MSDGHRSRQTGQRFLRKDIGHMTLALFDVKLFPVVRDDAGRFLPSMLERVETQVREIGGLLVSVNAEHGTLLIEFVRSNNGKIFSHRFRLSADPRLGVWHAPTVHVTPSLPDQPRSHCLMDCPRAAQPDECPQQFQSSRPEQRHP